MRELVALDFPAGSAFVDELRRAWDAGDAVLPIDQRLPHDRKEALLDAASATVVVDPAGRSRRDGRPTEPGDAIVIGTSGTTGTPKAAILTHDAVEASAQMTSTALDVDPSTDHWLCCIPVAHVGGLSVVTRSLYTETPLTVLPRFDDDAVRRAARGGATLVSLVVATLPRVDADQFRAILLGGSAIPAERPPNTVATYGMTETGSGIVYEGRPLDGVELRIDNGEIVLRSPTLFRGYRDGSDPRIDDGWYRTGDAGSLRTDGTLRVHGRMGDLIISGGENVWPVAVERALDTAGVDGEYAVVGREDAEWGQRVTVVLVPGADGPPDLAGLRDRLRDHLPAYALPRAIEVVDDLPRTELGKVKRGDL